MRRRSSITTTVPSANPNAVLLQWAGSASRPTGARSVSPAKATPAANRQRDDQTARPYSEQNQAIADGASTFLFLLTAAVAALAVRAIPRWLAWPALLLAVLALLPGPFGFLASMVFLAWAATAGITLLVARQSRPYLTHATVPVKEVRHA
jgi:hypothetical protein